MAAKKSQEPFSRPVRSQPAAEKKGRSPGEQTAGERVPGDVPAVQAAEEWQRTFDAVPDLIAILDTQYRVVCLNKAMAERLGLPKDRCVGQTCYCLVHGTDKPPPFCPHARLLQDGEEHTLDDRPERLAGDFSVTVSPLRDSTGSLVGSVHVARDVTKHKQAEHILRSYERIVSSTPDLISLVDSSYRYVLVNDAYTRVLGKRREEIVGKTVSDLFGEAAFRSNIKEPLDRCLRGEVVHYQWWLESVDGPRFMNVTYSPFLDADGGISGVVVDARDMTEQKRAEEQLQETEEFDSSLLSNAPIPMLVINQDTSVRYVNPALEKLTGFSSAEILGTKAPYPWWTPETVKKTSLDLEEAMRKGAQGLEELFQNKNGERFLVEITSTPVFRDGEFKYYLANWVDITEHKQAEEKLRESEARFAELFNNMSSGVAVYEAVDDGRDFVFKDFNKAGERIECTTKEKVIGRRVTEAFPGAKESGLLDVLQQVWRTGTPQHHPVSAYKDGRIAGWRENYVYRLPSGEVVAVYDDITARKQAEEDLIESESKFRAVFENAGGAIFIGDIGTGEILDCNLQAEKLLGRSRAELVGMHQSQLHPQGEEEKYRQKFAAHVKKGRFVDFEGEVQHSDGRRIPVCIAAQIMKLRGKEVIVGLFLDITERKQMEEALREAKDYTDNILRSMTDMLVVVSPEGRIVKVNQATCKLLGYPEDELIGQPASLLFEEEDEKEEEDSAQLMPSEHPLPVKRTVLRRLVNEGSVSNVEKSLLTKSGRSIPVLLSGAVMRDGDDEIRGIVCLALDITEQKRAVEAIEAWRNRYDAAVEATGHVLYDWDSETNDVTYGGNVKMLLGYTLQEIAGGLSRWIELIHPDDRPGFNALIERLVKNREPAHHEYRIRKKNGEYAFIEDTGRFFQDAEGKLVRMVGFVKDVSQRKQAEEKLRASQKLQAEAEKLAATGRMAAQVAHEINNPLAGIKNSFRLIRDAVPEDHPDHDMVGRIEREIDRIAHVVRQMYKLHSARAQTPADIPVEETICDVLVMLEPLRREHEVAIELAPVSPRLIVKVPEGSLQQVLYNLTANAIQASPRSGVVNILAEPVDKRYVKISIRDQGPGIPAEAQDRVFEPFYLADTGSGTREGIGLGLSIVRSIVESLEGKIEFESRAGEGTCFHVYLPSKQP